MNGPLKWRFILNFISSYILNKNLKHQKSLNPQASQTHPLQICTTGKELRKNLQLGRSSICRGGAWPENPMVMFVQGRRAQSHHLHSYLGYPPPRMLVANEGFGWDPLLKMVHNPGGDWHPGRGVDLTHTIHASGIFTYIYHKNQPFM